MGSIPSQSQNSRLFEPIKLGKVQLGHRVAMAPLTRYRNDDNHVATEKMVKYYSDRASVPGTLIISEATGVSYADEASPNKPAFVSPEQVKAWSKVIEAVHARGSFWFQQIWSLGRAADPDYIAKRGYKYKSSSSVPLKEGAPAPEAMTEEEIEASIQAFVDTAKRVVEAGGDGVEIHGAHGYLIEQFISDHINQRTDRWGGSIENRARFLLEVMRRVTEAIGADRVGVRLSPYASFQGALSSDVRGQYSYIIEELKKLNGPLAYISLVESRGDPVKVFGGKEQDGEGETLDFILEAWNNRSTVIVGGSYTPSNAMPAVDERYAKWDVVVLFGRHFLANPDLPFRVKNGIPLNPYDRSTFYTLNSEAGYNTYPFSEEFLKTEAGQKVVQNSKQN